MSWKYGHGQQLIIPREVRVLRGEVTNILYSYPLEGESVSWKYILLNLDKGYLELCPGHTIAVPSWQCEFRVFNIWIDSPGSRIVFCFFVLFVYRSRSVRCFRTRFFSSCSQIHPFITSWVWHIQLQSADYFEIIRVSQDCSRLLSNFIRVRSI